MKKKSTTLQVYLLVKNFSHQKTYKARKRMTNSHLRKAFEKFMWQRRKIAVDKKVSLSFFAACGTTRVCVDAKLYLARGKKIKSCNFGM